MNEWTSCASHSLPRRDAVKLTNDEIRGEIRHRIRIELFFSANRRVHTLHVHVCVSVGSYKFAAQMVFIREIDVPISPLSSHFDFGLCASGSNSPLAVAFTQQ